VRRSLFLLLLTFFGLTSKVAPQVRKNLFTQIHEIIFHGNGGYNWYDVYNMPIWLRKFTFNSINKHFQDQNEAQEKSQNDIDLANPDKGKLPERSKVPIPSYVTKASKK
jgi:hypothetical protein